MIDGPSYCLSITGLENSCQFSLLFTLLPFGGDNFNRFRRDILVVAFGRSLDTGDFVDCADALYHFGKDSVAETVITVIQVTVVFQIDEKLTRSTVYLLGPGHRQGRS